MPQLKHYSKIKAILEFSFDLAIEALEPDDDQKPKIDALQRQADQFLDLYQKNKNERIPTVLTTFLTKDFKKNISAIKHAAQDKLKSGLDSKHLEIFHSYLCLKVIKKCLEDEKQEDHPCIFKFNDQKQTWSMIRFPSLRAAIALIEYNYSLKEIDIIKLLSTLEETIVDNINKIDGFEEAIQPHIDAIFQLQDLNKGTVKQYLQEHLNDFNALLTPEKKSSNANDPLQKGSLSLPADDN